jgi:chromate reductase
MANKEINVFAISGSLRTNSSNTAILQAIAKLASPHINIKIFNGLGQLPHFNPDIDVDDAFVQVEDFRTQIKEADGVIICTPEYAKGVPGSLKNALDWIVSSGEFIDKPTAIISASPMTTGGDNAHSSLLLTLGMINANIVEGATLHIPHISMKLNAQGEVIDPPTLEALNLLLTALVVAI